MVRTTIAIAGVLLLAPSGCYSGLVQDEETAASTEGTGAATEDVATDGAGPGGGPGSDGTGGPDTMGSAEEGLEDGSDSSDGGSDATTDPDSDTGETGTPVDPEVEQLCDRWLADRADMSEGSWSGSVAACDPGDTSADGRANALRVLNLYRWMVGLPEVTTDASRNSMAQACALMMHANGTLSHSPPPDWACYSPDGATAAGNSNISGGPGVMSVDLYMVDSGNADTLGHRRWILANSTGPVGLGSTSQYSCMWVLGGSGGGANAWTAWPPPGPFPFEAVAPLGFASLDQTGWSLQSDGIDLSGAQVTITVDGDPRPVTVNVLLPGYGSASAISMVPNGWTAQIDTTYHVRVDGVAGGAIEYDVEIVGCG
jgi:uncharacterized protein YkwD